MRILALVLALILTVVAVWIFSTTTPLAPTSQAPVVAAIAPALQPDADRGPSPSPIAPALEAPDGSDQMLKRLNQVLSKLENLEVSVREARTEITLRSEDRSRTAVPAYPANATSKLGDQDLENLRTLIRAELEHEAWMRRQQELVDVARHLGNELQLDVKTIDPMIEILCTDEKASFDLERDLAEHGHERGLARRTAADFRLARRRLRDDLVALYRDEELAARLFLHVASKGEVASLHMNRERLFATEKEWLR